jgi:subtilisin family serine protease
VSLNSDGGTDGGTDFCDEKDLSCTLSLRIEAPNPITCLDGAYVPVLAYFAQDSEDAPEQTVDMSQAVWTVEGPVEIVDRVDTGHTSRVKIRVSGVPSPGAFTVQFALQDTLRRIVIERRDPGNALHARAIVGFEEGVSQDEASALFEAYGSDIDHLVTDELWQYRMMVGYLDRFNACERHPLLDHSEISFVVPDLQMNLANDDPGEPFDFDGADGSSAGEIALRSAAPAAAAPELDDWAVRKIKAHEVWTAEGGVTGKDIRVAVIDTGVERHRFLEDRVKDGKSFLRGEDPYADTPGHGTEMAGVIASKRLTTRTGQDVFVGVAPEAIIVPVKVAVDAGPVNGDKAVSQMVAAVSWAADSDEGNCKVINVTLLLEYATIRKNMTAAALDRIEGVFQKAKEKAILVVSAGNNNTLLRFWPASSAHAVSVGATNKDDERWVESNSEGSNYGFVDTATGRSDLWVKIAAPGKKVLTLTKDNKLVPVRGTSPAASMVSGTVALVLKKGRFTTFNQVLDRLQATGVTLTISPPRDRDQKNIGRRIDAKQAVLGP